MPGQVTPPACLASLPPGRLEPAVGETSRPGLLVSCGPYSCSLRIEVCLFRHGAKWASGRRRGTPRFRMCSNCPAGALRTRRSTWWRQPPPSQPALVMSAAQRRAKLRFRLENLEERMGNEPGFWAEADSLSPSERDAVPR
jgi:hypothetical protein